MLSVFDPITWRPRRIAIAGVSGSGKTTLAKHVSDRLAIPHVEIDGLFHGPNWQPRDEFADDVHTVISGASWVVEWQYAAVRDQIAERADTMLWLDLPTPLTLYQLTRRTLHRRLRRVELWNGNYEGPLHRFFTDPQHIVRWGIRTRNKYRDLLPAIEARHPHLHIVRLTSRRDSARWVGQAAMRG
ncbi:adenylate kinase [Mycolicibacterium canariasense]|uniref:Adenylate kinase n=1 Tax=Mycolicibacterium canariasense TaxID=228230 RepID=A0A100WCM4_MYCCR|nr:AAA family ATPase [Mycolicibacterium canariasense]MCV7212573.1 AAA family ATPase [Mycolicibacterium canariasense]ORV05365.1 AAA family ATPase [Mycolicibacterium canariasense]GAS95566.1 adenylate kinase [Mycolicibacterium canariasense]